MIIGAIDCGTNSLRLLIQNITTSPTTASQNAEPAPQKTTITELHRANTIVRLGEGTGATGTLSDAAITRATTTLRDYATILTHHHVDRIQLCATSAVRDAHNGPDFCNHAHTILSAVTPHTRVRTLTGDQEAELTFRGAVNTLTPDHHTGTITTCDIGGGSTELTTGHHNPRTGTWTITHTNSLNIGAVRLSEAHPLSDPPHPNEYTQLERAITTHLTTPPPGSTTAPIDQPAHSHTLIGLGGTFTTTTAVHLGLTTYDPARINQSSHPISDYLTTAERLTAMTRAHRRALGIIPDGRIDVIGHGLAIARTILTARHHALGEQSRLMISEHDILDGIALDTALNENPQP